MPYRLGLDLGTNSIGWVLYQLDDENEPEALCDGGVLIHSDGRNPRSRASNAAERRVKRSPRRNRDRMLRRRRRVAELLRGCGLLPSENATDSTWRNLDPLQLRAKALDESLTPYELGRVLLSLVNRRGFKSNRKTDSGEDGKVRKSIHELNQRITWSGARTLGEYLWQRHKRGKRIRARPEADNPEADDYGGLYPDRAMIKYELRTIRDAQTPHHPAVTPEDWDEIITTLLYQRNLRPVERGSCTLIPEEKRTYKAYPLFQHFRIWQYVVNIRVSPPGDTSRPLESKEREQLVDKLLTVGSLKFDRVAALLKLPDDTKVNFHSTARDSIDGDQTAKVLRNRKYFGRKGWTDLGLEKQQNIVEQLIEEEDHGELTRWLRDEAGLDEKAAEAVATARLPQGTGHLSKTAIEQLLPHMRMGKSYYDAVKEASFDSSSGSRGSGDHDRLPYYGNVLGRHVTGGRPDGRTEVERYGRVTNPTVHIALGQVRRLFNAIADRYGKPDQVVVELARELKQSDKQRRDYEKRQKKNRERNDRLRECATNAGFANPSWSDMRKLRLWEEQGQANSRVCPYTGESLSIGRVLSDETEIDHILPYSRSLDNSMNNTVVVMRHANREKGNRAPFETWGHDPENYDKILDRVKSLPRGKQWRFEQDAMERWEKDKDFLDRQLSDTRYLSRLVRDYLEVVVVPECIWVTPGRMTAVLRRALGLNSISSDTGNSHKNRNDHRHHLIDAAVIGLTSRSLLQQVARMNRRGISPDPDRLQVEPPWDGFRDDVEKLFERCIVRHRPDHFTISQDKQKRQSDGADTTSGRLHNETAYGIVDGPDNKKNMILVETKPLTDTCFPKKLKDVPERVRDHALRKCLLKLWEHIEKETGNQGDSFTRQRFAERAWKELRVRRVRVLTRMSEDSLAFIYDETGRPYKAYKTDGNAYMDIWLLPNGKTKGETVSRFSAHQPGFRSRIKCEHPTAKKLMRLHVNDMIAIDEGEHREILRVQKLSGQRITAVDHAAAGRATDMTPYRKSAGQIIQVGLRKVSIDFIGRLQDGGPLNPNGYSKNNSS
ncbi:MAG: type II CRISPR RNA-guided endonuclease Cas9 [Acidimicrobiaceae bacterium]|nr:type II CRISPR RNA-guided endonuclease Cas9 [Acidimicrobiaceae bacterium]